jgi:HlyD family secretion protein
MRLGRLITLATGAVIVGAIGYALWPKPVPVDTAEVSRRDLEVTVDEDGRTRVRDRYVVASPLAASLRRVELEAGDAVEAGVTVLAVLDPAEASLLDARQEREARARLGAAESALARASSDAERAAAALDLARLEHARVRAAAEERVMSRQELDRAEHAERMRAAELESARFAERVARFERDLALATLSRAPGGDLPPLEPLRIVAPVSGRVLRRYLESGTPVTPGQPIVEVGDPTDLEVEVDVLSADAVKIAPGAPARLEHWGGPRPLAARVKRVEPSGFLKISALGVEEQRVWVILEIEDALEARPSLGDGYRVEARIVVWEGRGVTAAPIGAVFRHGDGWAAFVVEGGRARLRSLRVGHQNSTMAEVLDGLAPGERVIVHPSEKVADGSRVKARP